MRYIKKSGTEPEDLQKYKRDCRRASSPLKSLTKTCQKMAHGNSLQWIKGIYVRTACAEFALIRRIKSNI